MAERMKTLKVGRRAQGAAPTSARWSTRSSWRRTWSTSAIGKGEGARLVAGGEAIAQNADGAPGYYLRPALFTDTDAGDAHQPRGDLRPGGQRDPREGLRGGAGAWPTTPSSACAAGIATTSLKYATHFKRHAQAGMVMVNLPTAGVDYHVPFGGRKGSSYGPREQGRYAAEFYTTVKTAYTQA